VKTGIFEFELGLIGVEFLISSFFKQNLLFGVRMLFGVNTFG